MVEDDSVQIAGNPLMKSEKHEEKTLENKENLGTKLIIHCLTIPVRSATVGWMTLLASNSVQHEMPQNGEPPVDA